MRDGTYRGIVNWLDDIPTTNWRDVAERFTEKIIEIDHPVWLYYLSDPVKALNALHLPNNLGEFLQLFKANLLDVRKWLDIVVNGSHDILHDAGLGMADDDKQSVVYQAVKDAWRGNKGYETATTVTKWVAKYIDQITPNIDVRDKAFTNKGVSPDSLYTPKNSIPKLNPKPRYLPPATRAV